jgi:hypothetical protein
MRIAVAADGYTGGTIGTTAALGSQRVSRRECRNVGGVLSHAPRTVSIERTPDPIALGFVRVLVVVVVAVTLEATTLQPAVVGPTVFGRLEDMETALVLRL